MSETVHTSTPELRHAIRALKSAGSDLRHAPSVSWRLFLCGVRARHRRAWLGYAWLVLPSLATTLIWTYVQWRRLVTIAPTSIPYPVYVLAGTILWQVFVDSLNAPLQQLKSGRQLITRSRVPHEALVLAGIWEVFLNFAVRLTLLAVVLAFFRVLPGSALILVPFGAASLAVLGLAIGWLAAPLGLLYDDVGRGLALAGGFWFFLTPVIYPAPASGILRFNPVTPLLTTTRAWLTAGSASPAFALITGVAAVMLVVAWMLQRLARPHVVARLG